MTTPTTPAAAVSLDELAGQLLECIDDTPWLTCNVAKSVVRSAAEELHMATARESALVAERDALRAHLAMWCHDGALQTFESREQFRKESRALAAPAVEGE